VDIYETSKDPKSITPDSHIIIFQPSGDKLIGAESITSKITRTLPSAYFRTQGNFDFAIPTSHAAASEHDQFSGHVVPQASIDKGKGRYAIAYPFRPGETSIASPTNSLIPECC